MKNIFDSLDMIANELEDCGMIKDASVVDGITKIALRSLVNMDQRVGESDINRAIAMRAATVSVRDKIKSWKDDPKLRDNDWLEKKLGQFSIDMDNGEPLTDLVDELNRRIGLYSDRILSLQESGSVASAKVDGEVFKKDDLGISNVGKVRSGSHSYDDIIAKASQKYNVPIDLIKSVIQVESRFNPNARSTKNAMGLMQLKQGTFSSMGIGGDIWDPEQNIMAGTKYLSQMIGEFGTKSGVAAYNAGPGNVRKYLQKGYDVPPFKETIQYVKSVLG